MEMKIDGNAMTFVLTDEEREAASWLSFSDEALGKMVKATALSLMRDQIEKDGLSASLTGMGVAVILANIAEQSNAGSMVLNLSGVTHKGKDVGDFRVTVEKIR